MCKPLEHVCVKNVYIFYSIANKCIYKFVYLSDNKTNQFDIY